MSKHLKTLSIYTLLALIAISIVPLAIVTPVKAQAEIRTTSDYLNPKKFIGVEVIGDLGPSISVELYDTAGTLLGSLTGIPSIGARTYRFYVAGPGATVPGTLPNSGYVLTVPATVGKGTTLRLVVLGAGVERILYYTTVKPTVTLDRSEYPYRRDAAIVITYVDPDVDYNPYALDTLSRANVLVKITVIKATGETYSTSKTLGDLGATPATATEKRATGGEFEFKITLSSIGNAFTPAISIEKDDRVILTFATAAGAQGGATWTDPETSVSFKAVYNYPSISVSFNYQKLVIEVRSPDDNTDATIQDQLDPAATITLSVAGVSESIPASAILETGVNTGVFRWEATVSWGGTASIAVAGRRVTLKLGVDGPFTASVTYKRTDPKPGYSIDVSGSGTYSPTKASVKLVRATTKVLEFEVTKPDFNTDPGSIEYIPAAGKAVITPGKFDVEFTVGGGRAFRVQLFDKDGVLVSTLAGFDVARDVAFFETDFNSGVFVLRINPQYLAIKAGEKYKLRFEDLVGFAAGKSVVELEFTVAPVAIKLDRDVYPARGTVKVYVTYENDELNKDATKIESAPVNWEAKYFDGTAFASGSITLTETGVNTGVFTGSFTISLPAADAVIGGKVVVVDPNRPEAKAEAEFRLRDGKLSVDVTTIGIGGAFRVRVEDPDANLDSKAKDSIPVELFSSRCGSLSKTLTETGENTGVFEATFTWAADKDASPCSPPTFGAPDTIEARYTDLREFALIEGYRSYSVRLTARVSVKSTTGTLAVLSAESGYVALLEKFTIRVVDPDLNVRVGVKDGVTVYISLPGRIRPIDITLEETGVSTGIFVKELTLSDLFGTNVITELAEYVGKQFIVMYRDDADDTGSISVAQQIITIRAYDPYVETKPKDFVNLGEKLEITVNDKNIAGWKTIRASVRSTTYPMPIEIPLSEVSPGVFKGEVTVVKPEEWVMGAPQVPARLGDTIDVIYEALVTSTGKGAILIKSVIVGRYLEIPAKVEAVSFLNEVGAPVTPKVGTAVYISVRVKNMDIIDRSMTVMIVVRDPTGVAVSLQFQEITLRPGEARSIGFGWIPRVTGKHTVEIYVVRSLADRTPQAESFTTEVTVS